MFDVGLLVLVEMNLEEPGAIKTDPGALANNLGRVDEVIENGIVHSHQSAGPGKIEIYKISNIEFERTYILMKTQGTSVRILSDSS